MDEIEIAGPQQRISQLRLFFLDIRWSLQISALIILLVVAVNIGSIFDYFNLSLPKTTEKPSSSYCENDNLSLSGCIAIDY